MKFTDRVTVELEAGKGGNGVVAWRREKYIPKGGPTGGSGGRGGSVHLVADAQIYALDWFRNRRLLKAENGGQGGSAEKRGKDGKCLKLLVPCGTLVKDVETGEILADLTEDGQVFIACEGGRGGRGNATFKTATNQAPNICTPGQPGTHLTVELELKLIAEVGLVGFPNAGKSTLLQAITRKQVKIAPYPFTTLTPNLSFIYLEDYTRAFIADIPGIIEGAHLNRGLGLEFLRHIERTNILIYILDASGIDGRDPTSDWLTLRNEITEYEPALLDKPFLVILNKIDDPASTDLIKQFYKKIKLEKKYIFEMSAAAEEGIAPFLEGLKILIHSTRRSKKEQEASNG